MCILLNVKIHFYEVQKDMSDSIVSPPPPVITFTLQREWTPGLLPDSGNPKPDQ